MAVPSIHIMGRADPLLSHSRQLATMYRDADRILLEHDEGHNIPSIRTEIYPRVAEWIQDQMK